MPQSADTFDAVVVGSGATGGWAAKKLTEASKKSTPEDFTEHKPPWAVPFLNLSRDEMLRDRPVQARCSGCNEFNQQWFVNDHEIYTLPPTTNRSGGYVSASSAVAA
jgi:hypothetical protein